MPLSSSSPTLQPVSIVIRSKNDAALIGATLQGVARQDYAGPIEVINIDSGSTDNTVEIIRGFRPAKLIQILAEDYVPGVVLNRGMREARSPWVVFLNSDCEPVNTSWLSELLTAAQSAPHAGTVYGRQVPRPDCRAVYAHDYERCFGPARLAEQWDHFFSMANSAVNRSAWEEQPFREDLQYSEDDEWSRRLIGAGWEVPYAEKAAVIHSHNYTLTQAFRRCYGEGFALAAIESVEEARHDFFRTVVAGIARESLRDLGYCARTGRLTEWPHAVAVRSAQRLGKFNGFQDGWAHYRSTNLEPIHV
jgi:rhamnosyltransferase